MTRAVCGIIAAVLIYFICFLNVFGLRSDVIVRLQPFAYMLCALMVVACVVHLVRASNTSLIKGIENFCKKTAYPDAMMARLERTWNSGLDFKAGRIDHEYIICLIGMHSKVIPLGNAVLAYKYVTRSGHAQFVNLMVAYNDGNTQSCKFDNQGIVDTILKYILDKCADIAVEPKAVYGLGSPTETEELFNSKDMNGLRRYARAQRGGHSQ